MLKWTKYKSTCYHKIYSELFLLIDILSYGKKTVRYNSHEGVNMIAKQF